MTEQPQLKPFTVCIPTYYGGASLVRAVESIRASEGIGPFRLIVAVDGNPLSDVVTRQLEEFDVDIVFSEQRGGQVARIKQMIGLVDTELTVLTQDDVVFDRMALARIVGALSDDSSLSMVGVHIDPVRSTTFFESVIEVGIRIARRVGMAWRGADNYLLASGRCLAFRTDILKQFDVPDAVVNSDAYLYFENRRHNGTFRYLDDAIVFNKSPLTAAEYLKQTKKFEYSKHELSSRFGAELAGDYAVSRWLLLWGLGRELVRHPLLTSFYCGLQIYARFQPNPFVGSKGIWETDVSTKRV